MNSCTCNRADGYHYSDCQDGAEIYESQMKASGEPGYTDEEKLVTEYTIPSIEVQS
jgi:hypothetical protein